MIRSPILVIGATGRVGREVVSQLVAEGARVRALSRDSESAVLPSDIEIFRGDLTIPDTLDAALDGVGSVFLVLTAPGRAFPAALDRIDKHAKRLVFLT